MSFSLPRQTNQSTRALGLSKLNTVQALTVVAVRKRPFHHLDEGLFFLANAMIAEKLKTWPPKEVEIKHVNI